MQPAAKIQWPEPRVGQPNVNHSSFCSKHAEMYISLCFAKMSLIVVRSLGMALSSWKECLEMIRAQTHARLLTQPGSVAAAFRGAHARAGCAATLRATLTSSGC